MKEGKKRVAAFGLVAVVLLVVSATAVLLALAAPTATDFGVVDVQESSDSGEYEVSGSWTATSITGSGTFDLTTGEVTGGTIYIPVVVTGDITASFNYAADLYAASDSWSGTSAAIDDGTVTINEGLHPATLWLKGDFTSFELTGGSLPTTPPTGWSCDLLCPVGGTHYWTTDDSKIVADFGWSGSCSGTVTVNVVDGTWTVATGIGTGTWNGVASECLAGKTQLSGAGTGTVSLTGSPEIANLSYEVTEGGTFILTRYESNPGGTPTKETLDKYIQVDSSIVDPKITWPVELRVYYTDAEVSGAEITESTLKMHKWDGTNWVVVTDSGVNTTGNYVWAKLTSFSPYSPLGDPAPAPTGDTTPPTIEFIPPTPANGSTVTVDYVTINVSVTDPSNVSTVLLNWNGVANKTMNMTGLDTWSVDKMGLSNGEYTYKVYANDTVNVTAIPLGNMGVSETRLVTVNVVGSVKTGDMDGSGGDLNMQDVILLARNVMLGATDYPLSADGDVDSSGGDLNMQDVILLARNVMLGATDYPLYP